MYVREREKQEENMCEREKVCLCMRVRERERDGTHRVNSELYNKKYTVQPDKKLNIIISKK